MSNCRWVLRAINPGKNVDRVYEIWSGRGLFNCWSVIIGYGRHGRGGTQKVYSFTTQEEMEAFVRKTLNKRFQSHKRIGCSYQVVYQGQRMAKAWFFHLFTQIKYQRLFLLCRNLNQFLPTGCVIFQSGVQFFDEKTGLTGVFLSKRSSILS